MKEIMDIITDLETKLEEQRLRADEATQAASKVCNHAVGAVHVISLVLHPANAHTSARCCL